MRLVYALPFVLLLAACSAPPQVDPAALESTAEAKLQSIPAADSARYQHVNMKDWRNPLLVITADGVDLPDYSNNEVHHLKPGEVVQELAKLPPAAWPYGRVVAAQEDAARSSGDHALIRKNR